jgi:hypothetical protein
MIYYLNSAFGLNLRRSQAGLPARIACAAQLIRGRIPRSGAKFDPLSLIRPYKRLTDPNPLSYPLSRSFQTAFIPFLISSESF